MGNIQGFDELNLTLGEMLSRAANSRKVLMEIGVKQVQSFKQNFREGGRPERWKPSQRAKKKGGQTLKDSGNLMNSITVEATDSTITFGSNLPYAAIHQFGGTINRKPRTLLLKRTVDKESGNEKVRFMSFKAASRKKRGAVEFRRVGNYSITMPARPYIVFQTGDVEDAGKILLRHMLAR